MKKYLLALSGSLFVTISILSAQPALKPSIGLSAVPGDNTSICTPACSGSYNFDTDGLNAGDTIPDFTLYTISGTPMNAATLLGSGKPLCIVGGNYTCPVWRGKIPDLNNLVTTYGSQVNFLVVYICEAHPKSPDVSPYSCSVWNPSSNQSDGVMYLQPTTYGQRKAVATDMINNTCSCMPAINAPMVIDGPCNEFWTAFGHAPNSGYLIRPDDGTIYCKHGWFNKAPNNDMSACISSLLSTLSTGENETRYNISVFPNPSEGIFRIQDTRAGRFDVSITTMWGENILTLSSSGREARIDLSGQAAGIYFYQLLGEDGDMVSGKLIVQ